MKRQNFDRIDRDLFKDMPSALKSSEEIQDEKRIKGVKRFLAIFAIATAGLATAVYTSDTESSPESPTETTLSNE